MKLNAIASAFILTMGLAAGSVNAADQGSGKVTFKGSIIDAACSINPDSTDQEVDLGQIAASQLKGQGTSTPRNFSINLENCLMGKDEDGNVVAPSVTVQFGGSQAVEGDKTWFGITGNASGAGVVITDASGTRIPVGGSTSPRELLEGSNTLGFSAYLQGLKGDNITTGEFRSVADFTLSYK